MFFNFQYHKYFGWLVALIIISAVFSSKVNAGTTTATLDVSLSIPQSPGSSGGTSGESPLPPPADLPPSITGITVTTTFTGAVVSWLASDEKGIASNHFVYGINNNYGTNGIIDGNFRVEIFGLATDTLYYYKISVTDTGNQTVSSIGTFRTRSAPLDISPPLITNFQVSASATMVVARWNTDELADSQMQYGLTSAYGSVVNDENFSTSHTLNIERLFANALYHYRVVATDKFGNSAATADATFVTSKDNIPPPNPFNFILATSSQTVTLQWTNPNLLTTPDFAGVTVVRKTNSVSASTTDGVALYSGVGTNLTDANVIPGVTYFYTIFAFDTSGNYSSGVYKTGALPSSVDQEVCNNNFDDDNNGKIDCFDDICKNQPPCQALKEVCDNGLDDDGNGLVDCHDTVCKTNSPCKSYITPSEVCANGIDDDGDGATDCVDADCGGFPDCALEETARQEHYLPPAITAPNSERLSILQLIFLAGNRQIRLFPAQNTITTLAGSSLTIELPKQALASEPAHISLKIDAADEYGFSYDKGNDIYISDIIVPRSGVRDLYVEVTYRSGIFDVIKFKLASSPWGTVIFDNHLLAEVSITLLQDGKPIDTSGYGAPNPFITNQNGTYGWVVPNGRYTIVANKTGFYERSTPEFSVTNNIITFPLELIQQPPQLLEVISPNVSLGKNAMAVTRVIGRQGKAAALILKQKAGDVVHVAKDAADNPEVQKVASHVVAPTAIGIAAVGTLPLITFADVVPLLRLLFLQPLMLLGLRRRSGWGQVYNALNKLPIDLATVRLISNDTNRVVQSKVTDKQGRYAFVVEPGHYHIEVIKNSMNFPSVLLKGFMSDGKKVDIYHGEAIAVTKEDAVITANIPLDPIGEFKKPFRLIMERWLRLGQKILFWFGLVVTVLTLYIAPHWYVWGLLALHIFFTLIFWRLARPPKVKSWGIVYDALTKEPIAQTVARLFSSQFNKLVATQITDRKGRYYFLAGDNQYFVTYEHKAYRPQRTDIIDLSGKDATTIAMNVELNKES